MPTKTMKYLIAYKSGCGDFHNIQAELWNLQRKTREIQNRTVRILYLWDQKSYENYKKNGKYLNYKDEEGCSDETYVSRQIKGDYPEFCAGNFSATIRKAKSNYGKLKKNVNRGDISLPTYKADQPILIRAQETAVQCISDNEAELVCPLFSKEYAKQKGYPASSVKFTVFIKDNTQRAIINRVVSGEYRLGDSQITYEKRKWFFLLSYSFNQISADCDPNKVLGVDMGVVNAIYASSLGQHERFSIQGKEVVHKAEQLEARRRSMQKQARYCGEGRIGHGTKTRVDTVFKAGEYLSDFRKTINHRYSRALVDFAIKYQYGVIQMEDLSGIKQTPDSEDEDKAYEKHRLLHHWTYYDLQQKIEYKAKEAGIEVKKVEPRYTSQRCSRCGCIDERNRPSQEVFECVQCGFKTNADYNASQNLSIPKIDKIIEKWLKDQGANQKSTENSI